MFRYKNTTLYNLMKINYVYVIHYVDHLFVIRHCDEADELLAIVWCHYDEENKIETLYRKTHCKLYTVPILFISLYFYNSDEDCTYFTATIIDCNMEVLDNEFMDHHYPSTVLENLKSLWLSKRLCDATLEAGPVKFYVWFKIIYTHICQKYVNLFLFHIFHWKPHLLGPISKGFMMSFSSDFEIMSIRIFSVLGSQWTTFKISPMCSMKYI